MDYQYNCLYYYINTKQQTLPSLPLFSKSKNPQFFPYSCHANNPKNYHCFHEGTNKPVSILNVFENPPYFSKKELQLIGTMVYCIWYWHWPEKVWRQEISFSFWEYLLFMHMILGWFVRRVFIIFGCVLNKKMYFKTVWAF